MIGLKIDKAKGMFFDSPKVMRAVDKAARQVLSKFGAFVRKAATQSIKKAPFLTKKKRGVDRTDFRTKISEPGNPPYSQTGFLKKFIYFGYDPAARSVVIGPARLNKTSGTAPAALEYGGSSSTTTIRRGKRVRLPSKVAARPFMHPALNKELPKLPAMWRDSVR